MVICVSGDYRSGKSNFSKRLTEKLGIAYYSMRKFKDRENGRNTNFINWVNIINSDDNNKIEQDIYALAKNGNCILDFRYSALVCTTNNIPYIGIWIHADLNVRVKGNSFFWKKDKAETKKIIIEREEQEEQNCIALYNQSYRNKNLYHLFIDTTKYWLPVSIPMDTTREVIKTVKYLHALSAM